MIDSCTVEKSNVRSFRAAALVAEVEESIKKQISRLAFGSLEMTVHNVFNRTIDSLCALCPLWPRMD